MHETIVYEPQFGLDGTIEQLVDWANRYTSDYTDEALRRISVLAEERKCDEKFIKIPLLLIDERGREADEMPYERMKIDYYLYGKFSEGMSTDKGWEIEVFSENDNVVISIIGVDEEGYFQAAGMYSITEFMEGVYDWLDTAIGQVLYYNKIYEEENL